jgi:hypothetical protein
MPGPLYHAGATAICPHGGQVAPVPTSMRVLVSEQPVALQTEQHLVAGCAFVAGVVPQPCLTVRWLVPATRVLVEDQPVLLQTSVGLALSATLIPAGPPIVAATQPQVIGT